MTLRSADHRRYRVVVRFRDTQRMTPGGSKSLAAAAALVGREKYDLHGDELKVPRTTATERAEMTQYGLKPIYGITRMDLVLRD